MTKDQFIDLLESKGYSYHLEGETLVVNGEGDVWFGGLTSLPSNTKFRNVGNVVLSSLKQLPLDDPDLLFQNTRDLGFCGGWISQREFPESRWKMKELITGK
jgi:hypothetical protein